MQREAMRCLAKYPSADGSIKFLWQLADGKTIESIYFTFQGRVYTCVSSQVGCNVHCSFCETGKQRNLRNLTAYEISSQVALIRDSVREVGGPEMLYQVAFAGMGEPLLNLEHVIVAAEQLQADHLTATVSISTSGIVPQIYRLAEHTATIQKLFISLHASTNEVRDQLVPINRKYPIALVLEAAHHFFERSGKREKVTATYLLFHGINDSPADGDRLMALLDPEAYVLQLSAWNPVADRTFVPSPHLDAFADRLQRAGYEVFIQRSKGQDIEGGCGQLRSRILPEFSARV
jgi:23S rRNA (adenine2503-C2)-methyltransferase